MRHIALRLFLEETISASLSLQDPADGRPWTEQTTSLLVTVTVTHNIEEVKTMPRLMASGIPNAESPVIILPLMPSRRQRKRTVIDGQQTGLRSSLW
ncbi:hypothetical protein [Segatella bryantii]|uniref:hypothetical protein n=1 Tax=Segatella bryantii TaxID=77095 RepID=UPI00115F9642|nr:hypothetical protein [Segatella bryantii]